MLGSISSALSLGSGGLDLAGTLYTNAQSKKEAKRNRGFQTYMSNTAYQRTMTDMKRAGLNPLLAANIGGASTPTGAVAPIQNPNSAIASYNNTKRTRQEVASMKAGEEKANSDTRVNNAVEQRVGEEILNIKHQQRLNAANATSAEQNALQNTAMTQFLLKNPHILEAHATFGKGGTSGLAGGILGIGAGALKKTVSHVVKRREQRKVKRQLEELHGLKLTNSASRRRSTRNRIRRKQR